MSDIRFNRWLHQSGTGGVYQDSTGRVGIGTSVPTSALDVQSGTIKIGSNTLSSSGVSTFSSVTATTVSATSITGVSTAGITTVFTAELKGNISTVTVPTGHKLVGVDTGSVYAPGTIIQVVFGSSTGSNSGAVSTWIDSPASVTITPKSSNNKIMIFADLPNNYSGETADIYLRLVRNGSVVSADYYSTQGYSNTTNERAGRFNMNYQYLDTPASTSALTYKMQSQKSGGSTTYYVNYTTNRGTHSIVAMEVAV